MARGQVRRSSGRAIKQKKSNSNRTLIIAAVVGVVIILAAAGLALSRNSSANIVGQQQFEAQGGTNPHIVNPTDAHPAYNSNPPTSGWHTGGNIGPWGVTTQPIVDEITVHNLEHGGIIIHYRQDLDQASVDQLTTLTRDLQKQSPCVLLIPRPVDKLPDEKIAVTAWTWLLPLQTVDTANITAFFRAHLNQGTEKVGCQLRS